MNIFELVAKLRLDSSEYNDELDKSEEKASSFGDKLKSGVSLGAKAGVAALGSMAVAAGKVAYDIGKSAMESYSNYEQLSGGIQKLYGDASDAMLKYAQQGYLTSGKSANEYMATATGFSAALIKSLNGDTQKAAEITDVAMRAISDNVNTFGSDASAVESAISGLSRQNYTMLDNLKLGYAGSAQGMLELINDSGVLGKTLTNTSELANVGFDQMIEAIQAVQEQQGIAGATAKEAMSTIEGSATATKAAWENVITAIGSGEGIADATSGLLGAIFGENEGEGLINQILPRIETIMEGISSFLVEASPLILEALANVVGIVAETMPGTIMTIIPVLFQAASTIISTLFGYIMDNLPTFMSAGIQLIQNIANGLSANLPAVLQSGVRMLTQLLSTIVSYLPQLLAVGIQLIGSLVNGIVQSVPSVLSGMGEIISAAWNAITSFDWLSLGKSIIDGIVNGITQFGSSLITSVLDMAKGAFSAIKSFFGINSPSRLMRDEIGKFIPKGLALGIEANADSVTDAMNDLSNMTVDAYDPRFSTSVPTSQFSDSSIIGAINELKATISQMQIVLDSGTLVGELTPAFDTALGNRAVYSGRGN